MESELNKKIRELLEKFGIETEYPKAKVIGKWSLVGHLKNLVEESLEKAIQEAREETIRELEIKLNEAYTELENYKPPMVFSQSESDYNHGFMAGKLNACEKISIKLFNKNGDTLSLKEKEKI
ncbi:MAG: hypothetical protein AABY22_17205 [Nanoarchaeota archaeon]